MKNAALRIVTLLVSILAIACAGTPGKVSQTEAVEDLNLQKGVALRRYDAVAYFIENAAVTGDPTISYQWQGATWLFSSEEHCTQFAADPARYARQFGGYCAFAIARDTTADGDPHQWAIVKDKLYVNNNVVAKKLWDQDRPGNIVAADRNWALIPKKPLSMNEPTLAPRQVVPAEAEKC
jgi:YHS domain-containing protein